MKLYSLIVFTILLSFSCTKDHAVNYSIDGRWDIEQLSGKVLVGTDNWIEFHPDVCCTNLSNSSHPIVTGTYDESYQVEFLDSSMHGGIDNRPFYISHDTLFSVNYVTPGGIKIYTYVQIQFYDHGHELAYSDGGLFKR